MNLPNPKADQHIYLERSELLEIEQKIRVQRHVERYALLRQFAKGVVCDAACGCGYGSYLLSTNPDVKSTIGVDSNSDIIDFASKEYESEKVKFYQADISEWVSPKKIDMLISVETIEHIADKYTLSKFCDRNGIDHAILTYPSKKTTHYNPYHLYDFKLQDILDVFSGFTCYRHFNWEYEFDVVFLIRNPYTH
ncbi:bifunctional 2-polyprenyl-6-hydroxyphenol methylase/3-demethylubiquinol 3-O-methyltransferase UbiG [Pseudanabaena sp. BC1403]|uniref:class I SAM-dependent methyltransferase n=1 Tax=Pseudanabaena sp. BC1403 TaxID=2043171 RepID=UPI000CD9445E|nr:class I SAM-dependent methyltransferase [Pseudanabaena sp. BC1403]